MSDYFFRELYEAVAKFKAENPGVLERQTEKRKERENAKPSKKEST